MFARERMGVSETEREKDTKERKIASERESERE